MGSLRETNSEWDYCAICTDNYKDPVVAEDGQSYCQDCIRGWFSSCRARKLPLSSPWTRAEIGEKLEPDLVLRARLAVRGSENNEKHQPQDSTASSILQLRLQFSKVATIVYLLCVRFSFRINESVFVCFQLDGVEDVLSATLEGYEPPQVIDNFKV